MAEIRLRDPAPSELRESLLYAYKTLVGHGTSEGSQVTTAQGLGQLQKRLTEIMAASGMLAPELKADVYPTTLGGLLRNLEPLV